MTPEEARAFVARASWAFASTMPWSPHEYTTRAGCRARGIEPEFESFVRMVESDGFWRAWDRHRWRSITIDEHVFWLHWNLATVAQRTVVNRWWRDRMAPAPAQLSLEVGS
jgi:hypothetical protein